MVKADLHATTLSRHMFTTNLWQELFRVNQTYYLLAIVVYDMKNVVLKPNDNHNHRQFYIMEIVYDFSMTWAVHAMLIPYDNHKQKSYPVNLP